MPVMNRIIVVDSGSTRKRKSRLEAARFDPREAVRHLGARASAGWIAEQREEHDQRADERERHQAGRDPARLGLADALAEQQQQDRAECRERGDDPGQVEDVALRAPSPAQPFNSSTSSAVTSWRRRKIATMIARPTATSAAATTRVKNTITWPLMSFKRLGERDERQVRGVEHQLDAHEHHERVLAHQQADRADREQERREDQVVGRRDVEGRDHAFDPSIGARSARTDAARCAGRARRRRRPR